MTQEKKTISNPPSAGNEHLEEELDERELGEIAGGSNPFTVTDENGNPIDVTHGEHPEQYGIL